MKVKVCGAHQGYSQYRTYKRGEIVVLRNSKSIRHKWIPIKIEGVYMDIPEHYIKYNQLLYDYNPTELTVHLGDVLEVIEIAYDYAMALNIYDNRVGWVPLNILESITVAKNEEGL